MLDDFVYDPSQFGEDDYDPSQFDDIPFDPEELKSKIGSHYVGNYPKLNYPKINFTKFINANCSILLEIYFTKKLFLFVNSFINYPKSIFEYPIILIIRNNC